MIATAEVQLRQPNPTPYPYAKPQPGLQLGQPPAAVRARGHERGRGARAAHARGRQPGAPPLAEREARDEGAADTTLPLLLP